MSENGLSLRDLEPADEFARRHIGPDEAEIGAMLEVVGAASLDELIERATPRAIRSERPLKLPPPKSETEALAALRAMAGRNRVLTSMIGMGYYGTITPAVILRNVLENPGWYTAYTPYQAEVSQGRLEALLTFQQMVADLTGLELGEVHLDVLEVLLGGPSVRTGDETDLVRGVGHGHESVRRVVAECPRVARGGGPRSPRRGGPTRPCLAGPAGRASCSRGACRRGPRRGR